MPEAEPCKGYIRCSQCGVVGQGNCLIASPIRPIIGNVTALTVFEKLERNQHDDRQDEDVDRNGLSGSELVDQPGCNQSCGTTGDDQGELVAQPSTRMPEAGRERPFDDRCLWPVLHCMRNEADAQGDERQPGDRCRGVRSR